MFPDIDPNDGDIRGKNGVLVGSSDRLQLLGGFVVCLFGHEA